MKKQLFLLSDVADRLQLPPHRIAYLLVTKKLEEPALRLGNRRIFTEADVKRVAKALGRTLVREEAHGQ